MRPLRIFFTKTGEAAYISHLDLQRVMARALRISGLPVWYSQGFNPHIYMSFALPLPLLHESVAESVDCKTESEADDFSAFVAPLSAALPRGIEVTCIAPPVYGAEVIARADYLLKYADAKALGTAVEAYNAAPAAKVLRKTKRSEQEVDLKAVLPHIALPQPEGSIQFALPAGAIEHYSPALLARWLEENGGLPAEGAHIVRKAVYARDGKLFL